MASRRLSYGGGGVDEEAKLKNKHQDLLQEYLVLQKECVSKKRKLKETKEKKETLQDELRFLKRRRDFLLKMRSQNSERQQEIVQTQAVDAKNDVGSSRRYTSASEQAFPISRPALGSMWNSGSNGKAIMMNGSNGKAIMMHGSNGKANAMHGSNGKAKAGLPPLHLGKKPKDMFTNGKRGEKRKISWQDQLALKV